MTATFDEVSADERGRVTLKKAGVHGSDRFMVTVHPTGAITLTPVTSIPKREMIVWENESVRAALQLGIAEAEAGLGAPNSEILARLEAL